MEAAVEFVGSCELLGASQRYRARVLRDYNEYEVEGASMRFTIDVEQEEDGRWIGEVPELPGTLAYGVSREEAIANVQALALRVVADRLEHGEAGPEIASISFHAA